MHPVVRSLLRELAYQICDQFVAFGAGMTLHALVVVGGEDMRRQAAALSRRPHVVVATPGRLVDHLRSDPALPAAFARVRFLVLDEADRLLEPAVEPELEAISDALPKKRRQTLLFSATITRGIAALQARRMRCDTAQRSLSCHHRPAECHCPSRYAGVRAIHTHSCLSDWPTRIALGAINTGGDASQGISLRGVRGPEDRRQPEAEVHSPARQGACVLVPLFFSPLHPAPALHGAVHPEA